MENKHPSKWTELPKGVVPVIYSTNNGIYTWSCKRYGGRLIRFLNEFVGSDCVLYNNSWLTMVEFNNGWIWEAGGRGWRRKEHDTMRHLKGVFCKCTDGDFLSAQENGADCGLADKIAGRPLERCPQCGFFPWAYKAPIASDSFRKATVGEKLSTKYQIIPLREKVYGRDTHKQLMMAHYERTQTEDWNIGKEEAVLQTRKLVRSLCGDALTYDGVEETK